MIICINNYYKLLNYDLLFIVSAKNIKMLCVKDLYPLKETPCKIIKWPKLVLTNQQFHF